MFKRLKRQNRYTAHQINSTLFFVFSGVLFVFVYKHSFFWFLWGALLLVSLYFFIGGIVSLRKNYFLRHISRLDDQRILLTFDDGPHPVYTPQILNILEKHNIGAFFFVIGSKVAQYPALVEQMYRSKYGIGNHTYNHPHNFALLSQKKIEQEIERCDQILTAIGLDSTQFFRVPIGYSSPPVARAIGRLNKLSMAWTFRSFDTVFTDKKKLLRRLVSKVKKHDIVLLHDTLPQTATVLEDFIIQTKKRGFQFVTNQELDQLWQ